MADYGIRVSRPGYNVLTTFANTATNIKLLNLVTSVSLLKIYLAAKVTLASGNSVTIAHGFAYKPLFWVFLNDGTDLLPVYNTITGTRAYIDATELVITYNSGGTKDLYYYIFYDPV